MPRDLSPPEAGSVRSSTLQMELEEGVLAICPDLSFPSALPLRPSLSMINRTTHVLTGDASHVWLENGPPSKSGTTQHPRADISPGVTGDKSELMTAQDRILIH